jgi:hypothetical protein
MMRCAGLVAALAFLSMSAEQLLAAESLDESIKFLLDYVAKSDATFIRNGQTHTPREAVNHIKAKYEHFKSEIKTPEDFIRLSASKSLLTGQAYLVRTPDGKEMQLSVWLTTALEPVLPAVKRGMSLFHSDKNTAAGRADFSAGA